MKYFYFILIFLLLFLISCGGNDKKRINQYDFMYVGEYNNEYATWYVRCWDQNQECEVCQMSKEPFKCDTGICTDSGVYAEFTHYSTQGLDSIKAKCLSDQGKGGGSKPDPNKPSNLGVAMYMASKFSYYQKNSGNGYGYDDYPDRNFEDNYKEVDNSYSPKGLFDNLNYYYERENYDFLSLEVGGQSSFCLKITEDYFKNNKGKLSVNALGANAPISLYSSTIWSNSWAETCSLSFVMNNYINIRSTSNLNGSYEMAIEAYTDPRNPRALVDNILNVVVYDKKQIANNKIAVILLNNPNVPADMKTSQGWQDYLAKYLRQAVIYPPEEIKVYPAELNEYVWDLNSNGIIDRDSSDFSRLLVRLGEKYSDIENRIDSARNGDISLVFVGKWKTEYPENGFAFNGISYIIDTFVTKHTNAHELFHTTQFGSMKHVNDPVNLMYPTAEYNMDILRHRTVKEATIVKNSNTGKNEIVVGSNITSQWEQLRSSKAIQGN